MMLVPYGHMGSYSRQTKMEMTHFAAPNHSKPHSLFQRTRDPQKTPKPLTTRSVHVLQHEGPTMSQPSVFHLPSWPSHAQISSLTEQVQILSSAMLSSNEKINRFANAIDQFSKAVSQLSEDLNPKKAGFLVRRENLNDKINRLQSALSRIESQFNFFEELCRTQNKVHFLSEENNNLKNACELLLREWPAHK